MWFLMLNISLNQPNIYILMVLAYSVWVSDEFVSNFSRFLRKWPPKFQRHFLRSANGCMDSGSSEFLQLPKNNYVMQSSDFDSQMINDTDFSLYFSEESFCILQENFVELIWINKENSEELTYLKYIWALA